ncbi:hypothetical protein [Novosphingobium mangrovi (ex Huang et al. 2023)]|uniref:Lipoprotein n=1 Tax=Novosphingobium mangrovi (ex Huang et al. 2023) TaxID=2976432 RepID=A0ABT2I9D1_9SPHN|nr:hypothetical protein [Novosphingobium mangrovi (ex Huang et al. 2023)]MCT2401173.1 hypothetical protein [Novosphingobium mangrovi (ex Huang et al. 2023)]
MTILNGALRMLPAALAACGLAACSSSTGIGFNGGVPPIGSAPVGGNGCSPSKGAVGGIGIAGKLPRASSGTLATTSGGKPSRADSKPARADHKPERASSKPERAGTKPARQKTGTSPQSGAAGSYLSAPSGC